MNPCIQAMKLRDAKHTFFPYSLSFNAWIIDMESNFLALDPHDVPKLNAVSAVMVGNILNMWHEVWRTVCTTSFAFLYSRIEPFRVHSWPLWLYYLPIHYKTEHWIEEEQVHTRCNYRKSKQTTMKLLTLKTSLHQLLLVGLGVKGLKDLRNEP